jgi:hypothetical protein
MSTETSKKTYKIEEEGPFVETVVPNYIDQKSDPELKQVWNHPVYIINN